MSSPLGPSQPANDSKAASIAWAVAAIVVALVVAFIAWLAMGERGGSGTAGADPTPDATATQEVSPGDGEDTGLTNEGDAAVPDPAQDPGEEPGDAAEQSPPPEIEEFMLGLQRRDADDPMAVGDVDAAVVMIEYADYRCPYCARFATQTRPELDPLVEDGTLRIEFRDLVLFEETSELAAVAARSAAEQGHLEDYQQALFGLSLDGHGDYAREDLVALAAQVGVPDLDAFQAGLDDPDLQAAVQADTEEARSIGLTSTPTFLINTQVVQGAYPVQHFRSVIEAEVAKVGQDSR